MLNGELLGVMGRGGHPRQHHHPTSNEHSPFTQQHMTTMGAAHIDTHQVGCVEGRVVRRWGGRAPAPTRQLRFHQHQSTIHNLQNNNGGGSIRHPLSGVCGRESCQALWGGKGTRANTTTPASPTPIHHTQPSKQLWGRLNSTPTKWGVWKGELSGVVGGGHLRQHDHFTCTNTNPPYSKFTTTMRVAHFDIPQVGRVGERSVRLEGGGANMTNSRSPTATLPQLI